LSVDKRQADFFNKDARYCLHPFLENNMLVSCVDGWTFPFKTKEFLPGPPMLMVRNKGGVTSESSTVRKGYAHQFVNEQGEDAECIYKRAIFPEAPDIEWMLVPHTVNAVWLQYGDKSQYLGEKGYDILKQQFGKLIIFRMTVDLDIAPCMDRKADITELHDHQYRVRSTQLLNTSWSISDQDSQAHLFALLAERRLEKYQRAVAAALARAGFLG